MFGDVKENSIQRVHSSSVLPIRVDDTKGNASRAQPTYYVSYLESFGPGSDVVVQASSKPTSVEIFRDT